MPGHTCGAEGVTIFGHRVINLTSVSLAIIRTIDKISDFWVIGIITLGGCIHVESLQDSCLAALTGTITLL